MHTTLQLTCKSKRGEVYALNAAVRMHTYMYTYTDGHFGKKSTLCILLKRLARLSPRYSLVCAKASRSHAHLHFASMHPCARKRLNCHKLFCQPIERQICPSGSMSTVVLSRSIDRPGVGATSNNDPDSDKRPTRRDASAHHVNDLFYQDAQRWRQSTQCEQNRKEERTHTHRAKTLYCTMC